MPFDKTLISSIINEARAHGSELPWIEFKTNFYDPQAIGEYISALSNTAALFSQSHGFMIWGVDDSSHQIIGTNFDPATAKQGNQGIDLWIATQLDPQVQFYFHKDVIEGKNVVLLEVTAAYSTPVKFRGIDYIRIDSYKKTLKDFPDTERELWATLSRRPFETLIAIDNLSQDLMLRMLDYPSYFDLLSMDLPSNKDQICEYLLQDKLITKNHAGLYDITNLGGLLFAKRLTDFPSLERKAIRVIIYKGDNRITSARKELTFEKGYANGFEALIAYTSGMLPENEVIGKALRKTVPMYPELAIRELIANAIIHQNFFLRGTSVMIELFENRLEITNPGAPLIEKERFIDYPPQSRNEILASFMRRIGVCEERGSGFDKVVYETEQYQLPAPEIEVFNNHTKVTLYAHQEYSKMTKQDKIRACYLHACLKRVNKEYMTNATLRERFAISQKNISQISKLLSEACESKLIKVADPTDSAKNRRYVPYWA